MSIEIRKKEKELLQQEQAAYVRTSQRFNFIDDDDDEEYSFATQEYLKKFSSAITPDLPKSDSLIMEDKHLDTIPATKSDELIMSSVEDLVHTPSESDGISESEYDLPVCDDSSLKKDEVDLSSAASTSYLDLSLLDYEAFFCDSEPDLGNFTMDVVEDIFDNPIREPRVHVPNVLPTHPTLQLDSDFTLFRIFIEVQSKRFLSPNEFSISFICDPLSLVFDTLLPFSSENEDNVFNPGILASNEEKSPHLLSHRGFKAFHLIFESPMMIYGENIPILDVLFLHFYPP
ncbi:hypothetical protein Tco_0386257 [Tanacetum coccineum]